MTQGRSKQIWVKRHSLTTRMTHGIWAVSVFFLLPSGWQIFHAGFYASGLEHGTADPSWRRIHIGFAWCFAGSWFVWLIVGLTTGRIARDLWPRAGDWCRLARDILAHAALVFQQRRRYGPLQRLSYGCVLFGLFPLVIMSGLIMALPTLSEGGRELAGLLHFVSANGLSAFFILHLVMVFLAGPVNKMRAISTGWYRLDRVGRVDG